jgi:hypothetical protein
MCDATDADAGLVSGLANTSQQVGGALGISVLAAVAAARTDRLGGGGLGGTEALAGGFRLAFAVAAVLALAALVVAALVLRTPARRCAEPEPCPA